MRYLCFSLLLVFSFVGMLRGETTNEKPLPGYYTSYKVNSKGKIINFSYTYTGEKMIPEHPIESIVKNTPLYSDTAVLWVDRNHQNAIAENVAISNDGMSIFAGWWLNNERASLYRSIGNGVPLWAYSMPLAAWQIDVASSNDGHLIAAASSGSPFRFWDKSNAIPIKEFYYPSGFSGTHCAVSKDGSIAAAAADNGVTGRFFVFNANGDSLYAVDFDRSRGLYGLELSSDGSIAVVSTYDVISVFENGVLRDTISNYGQTTARVSGDGNRIVKGDFSGNVTLYEWNGSSYNQLWQSHIGGPWVVTVDISEDGSTIMAGTGYSNGKSVMFDASSSTPLWTYQNYGSYGAYVHSVSLSGDGSIGAAASWGDTAQTGDFYVLTVHSKSSSTPIIGVTRNDEPGSLFDCDISGDGQHITAGGKAVHAYQWGNGGEVYSVLVGSTPAVNAATESIDQPGHLIQVGNVISPKATFKNYGDDTASFNVYFSIEDSSGAVVYSSSDSVDALAPGATIQKTFTPDWTPTDYNRFKILTWCELVGDQYPGDDTLSLTVKCFHDVEARTILVPFDETTVNMEITPEAMIYNNGSYTETIEAILSLKDSLGVTVYTDTVTSGSVSPESQANIMFSPTSPSYVGGYVSELQVNVSDDINPSNNFSSKNIYVSYEIIYDDGTPEVYYIVSGSDDNNKFAVRFTPTLTTPFYFTGGRIYVNATSTFDYVELCDDASGLPDTISPLRVVNNVGASSAPGWAQFSFDSFEVTTARDFWIVLHWSPSSPGSPGVGADNFSPSARSWWYNNTNGWNNWTSHNWMIRLMQKPLAGISSMNDEEKILSFHLYKASPNPFAKKTKVAFDIPQETRCSLTIYDSSGRRIKTLINKVLKPGEYVLHWMGKNTEGKMVSNGIYFYRLQTSDFTKTQKVIFIK